MNEPPISGDKPAVKSVKCPACGAAMTLRALGQSVAVACESCGSLCDVSRPEIQIIQRYQDKTRHLRLPLGKRCELLGQEFEVVGAMGRKQEWWKWDEFLLFNPYVGFRWLVCDHGNWSFVEPIKTRPVTPHSAGGKLQHEESDYRLFNTGSVVVEWVVGEFYWRVRRGERVTTTDYIAPPHMVCCETSEGEKTWSKLTLLDRDQVTKLLGVEPKEPTELAPHAINPAARRFKALWPIMAVGILLAILLQGYSVMAAKDQLVSLGVYSFAVSDANPWIDSTAPGEQVFGPIRIDADRQIHRFDAVGGVDNSWVELDCALVDERSGRSFEFSDAYEYYHGRDSDGSWSEGSRGATTLLTSIPAGEYSLVVSGRRGGDAAPNPTAYLSMRLDIPTWRNFWLVMLLLPLVPLVCLWRAQSFEQRRWQNSSFNPYSTDDE